MLLRRSDHDRLGGLVVEEDQQPLLAAGLGLVLILVAILAIVIIAMGVMNLLRLLPAEEEPVAG